MATKKTANKIDINAIIEEGIAAGAAERNQTVDQMRQQAENNEKTLTETFNKASQLLEGLNALKNRKYSAFDFEVTRIARDGSLLITTNLPADTSIQSYERAYDYAKEQKIEITVAHNGTITAYNNVSYDWDGGRGVNVFSRQKTVAENGDPTEILKLVAAKAARKGYTV